MQKFYSKIDWWVLGFLIAVTGLLVQLLLTMYAKGTMVEYPEHTAVYVLTIAVLWWPVFNTRYSIQNDTLTVRCMFLKWVIPLANIQQISKTSNPISSPALSLDRLKIEYIQESKIKHVLISPRNSQQFCQVVQSQNTQIQLKVPFSE
ncbi:PH domain-containing protein [uncultured Acinetobacter sp.]|uniref:PH domain-containing protein n=1 Tax=uncultured Acinetobacter sp. TaxID=165433 RepID=UPI0025F64DA6|nr:PH domain-containing protein [uncultured Acinetobacter sp.]